MKPLKHYFTLLLLFSFSLGAFAQDEKTIENDLRRCFMISQSRGDSMALVTVLTNNIKILQQRIHNDSVKGEQAVKDTTPAPEIIFPTDTTFTSRLLYYTNKVPATLKMPFKMLTLSDVNIMSGDDSLFRIYVWKQRYSTYRNSYKSVFQFKRGSGVKACLLPHTDTALTGAGLAFYDAIYTLITPNKTYYLASYINKYATNKREEGMKVFCIDSIKVKGKTKYILNDTVHIIQTKTGLHNELSYKYDVIASGDAGSDNGVSYDSASRSIEIPVVSASGKMTEMHITYKFNGQYFERVEEDKPKKKLRAKN